MMAHWKAGSLQRGGVTVTTGLGAVLPENVLLNNLMLSPTQLKWCLTSVWARKTLS